MPALIIAADGDVREEELPEKGEFGFLQQRLNHQEPVPYALTSRWLLWASSYVSTGEANQKAQSLARRFGYELSHSGAYVVTATAEQGEVVNLTDDQVRVIRAMIGSRAH